MTADNSKLASKPAPAATPVPVSSLPPAQRPSPPIQAQPHLENISQRTATPSIIKVGTTPIVAHPYLANSLNLGEPKAGQVLTGENKGEKTGK